MGHHALARRARRARPTMVIRLGRPRVRGIIDDLLEVEVPLDAEGVGRTYSTMLGPRDRTEQRSEDARRDDVAERVRDAQRLLDAQEPGRDSS
jgi:hypothetical protein